MGEEEALGFIQNASRKIFRSEVRRCAVGSESPVAPNMRRYGGAMVMVHPHHYGRVVARFTDARGLGRYAAVTLRGKNGVLITFNAVHLTPAPGGESGQEAAQRRYIARHTGKLAAREPYALAVRDLAELIEERHRAGSVIVMGGDLQTDISDGSGPQSQLLQRYWGGADMILPSTTPGSTPWDPGPDI